MNKHLSNLPLAITAFVDAFIHVDIRRDPDLLSRGRFLVLLLMAGTAVFISVLVLSAFSSSAPAKQVVIPMMIGNIVLAACLLHKLRLEGGYRACSLTIVAQTWIDVFATATITGGTSAPAALQLFSIPCMMAFFLCGNQWGSITALLSMTATGFMAFVRYSGYAIPSFGAPDGFPFSQRFLLPINFVVIACLSLVYELTYVSVKRQRDREHLEFQKMAATDPLTGLANRRMFDETLAAKIELFSKLRQKRKFALCCLDLDKFKPINDKFGHHVGDEVLYEISSRLRSVVNGSDFISRQGGDEFLILLESIQNMPAITAMAKRLQQKMSEPINTSVGVLNVGASLGFAMYPDAGASASSLQKAADEAMYEAKRNESRFKIHQSN